MNCAFKYAGEPDNKAEISTNSHAQQVESAIMKIIMLYREYLTPFWCKSIGSIHRPNLTGNIQTNA
jgi:hypothetical protein